MLAQFQNLEALACLFAGAKAMNHYEVLQVRENADADEIRTAYLRLVRRYHPDRHVGEENGADERLRFQRIQEAYEVLHDPEHRREYDRVRQAIPQPRGRRPTVVTPAPPQRRDVPHDWIQRRLPRKRRKIRVGRILFSFVVVAMAAAMVPRCSRMLELNSLPLDGRQALPLPSTRDDAKHQAADPSSANTPVAAGQQDPLSVHALSLPPTSDSLESEPGERRLIDEAQRMIDAVPDFRMAEWMSEHVDTDWQSVITASAELNSFPHEEDFSVQPRHHSWQVDRSSDDTVPSFEAPALKVSVFSEPIDGESSSSIFGGTSTRSSARRFPSSTLLRDSNTVGRAASPPPPSLGSSLPRPGRHRPGSFYSVPSMGQLSDGPQAQHFGFSRPTSVSPSAGGTLPSSQPRVRATGILPPSPSP